MSARPALVRWSDITALFGGTFDPPHLGHRAAVQGLFSSPGVGRVLVLPSPSPAHKPTIAGVDDRVAMARLAFAPTYLAAQIPLSGPVEIDLRELTRARHKPGIPTYTFDTLSELRREIPQLAFVIGTDQLQKFHTWHRFPEVLGLVHWIVLERKSENPVKATEGADTALQVLKQWEASGLVRQEASGWRTSALGSGLGATFIQTVPTPAPALSSTQIRESLARSGNLPDHVLLPDVKAYLMQRCLYGIQIQTSAPPRK